jgi:pimeloyl-ACP methyl ester carboxylesterase
LIYRILICIILVLGIYQLVTHFYRDEEKELRTQVRTAVKEAFPEHQEEYAKTIGLFRYKEKPGAGGEPLLKEKAVVLIHGLDDPGKVWQNLGPALVHEGYDVWQFEYPNDQPLADSAEMLFQRLQDLRTNQINHISIVAHSMGGLISRELLTSTTLGYRHAIEQQKVPEVELFIMVGTPNHGSHMVQLRFFSEIRDHIARLLKGQTGWLNFIFDGAGEAKIDLLPGSSFLNELNGRPHPEDMEQLIIAGITSPWNQQEIDTMIDSYSEKVSGFKSEDLDTIKSLLAAMTDGLGDGLVSVESTRLPGIAHMTVKGTHLSMIRNLTPDSERVPPALPIIIRYLNKTVTPEGWPPSREN